MNGGALSSHILIDSGEREGEKMPGLLCERYIVKQSDHHNATAISHHNDPQHEAPPSSTHTRDEPAQYTSTHKT